MHYANCVVGDLNESGLLVSDQATVAMIDADSFEVEASGRRFLCAVGKDDFTAPEFALDQLGKRERTRNHDAFGLAVLIFHLLFLGRSPFGGIGPKGDLELRPAMEQHCFAFSLKRDTGVRPPPGTLTLADLSPILAAQFESAFAPVGRVGLRPRPTEWVDSLDRFERELIACRRRPLHRFHPAAGQCSWCRIEAETGRDPF
ncbi:MAG: hypothetical protein JWN21_1070 [Sphingomonas bacterium]|nr:hypothetical protein [Sphingomonas bacterium]